MTTPDPLPLEPLLTPVRLAAWAQENPLLDPTLADLVIDAVSTLVRQYGDAAWTAETLPKRASDIAYICAKDYYLNPTQLRQETIGPLQSSWHDTVLNGLDLTDSQKAELAELANDPDDLQMDGLFSLGFTRGPVETHQESRHGSVLTWDTRGGWPIEYLNGEDRVVFEPV